MRLLLNNLATLDNSTIATENSTFPLSNAYNNYLIEKTSLIDNIAIDLGSAQGIDTFSFIYTGTANITLKAGTTSAVTDYSSAITDDVTFFNTETYRYWQIETDADIFVSHIYLGDYVQLSVKADPLINPEYPSTDVSNTSTGGQNYSTPGVVLKNYSSFTVVDVLNTSYQTFITWWLSTNRINHFMFVPFEDNMTTFNFIPFYCKLTNPSSPVRSLNGYYEWNITITEVK